VPRAKCGDGQQVAAIQLSKRPAVQSKRGLQSSKFQSHPAAASLCKEAAREKSQPALNRNTRFTFLTGDVGAALILTAASVRAVVAVGERMGVAGLVHAALPPCCRIGKAGADRTVRGFGPRLSPRTIGGRTCRWPSIPGDADGRPLNSRERQTVREKRVPSVHGTNISRADNPVRRCAQGQQRRLGPCWACSAPSTARVYPWRPRR